MSRNPTAETREPQVIGGQISGNARLRVRSMTTDGGSGTAVGVHASGGSVVILGDVVTRSTPDGVNTTVTGDISVRGNGRVEVGGRVIENGVDITDTISVTTGNPGVRQTEQQRLFSRSQSPVEIYVVYDGRINFREINEDIRMVELRDGAPESAKLRFPKNQESNIIAQLKNHPRVISVAGEMTQQGITIMDEQTRALRAIGPQ